MITHSFRNIYNNNQSSMQFPQKCHVQQRKSKRVFEKIMNFFSLYSNDIFDASICYIAEGACIDLNLIRRF